MGKWYDLDVKGDFRHVRNVMRKAKRAVSESNVMQLLEEAGAAGVRALRITTPKDTGKTADSWWYEITKTGENSWSITFCNDRTADNNKYVYIAQLLEYGHFVREGPRTRMPNGRLVRGRRLWKPGIDYINPALDPVFKDLSRKAIEQVGKAFAIRKSAGDVHELKPDPNIR